jgi:hypothetical protein
LGSEERRNRRKVRLWCQHVGVWEVTWLQEREVRGGEARKVAVER